MSNRVFECLVVLSESDVPTIISSNLASLSIDIIKRVPHVRVTEVKGLLYPFMMTNYLKQKRFDMIIYFGHGQKQGLHNYLTGSEWSEKICSLSDAIFYSYSCWTASGFGVKYVDKPGRTFIGYTEPVFVAWDTLEWNYGRDYAKVITEEILNIFSGMSLAEAVRVAKDRWATLSQFYNILDTVEAKFHSDLTMRNSRGHVILGETARNLPLLITRHEAINLIKLLYKDSEREWSLLYA